MKEPSFPFRQPVWKKVKVLRPHCPICKEELSGDNSQMFPYKCFCGFWKGDWMTPGIYKITPPPIK
jgi:hypothetical protein